MTNPCCPHCWQTVDDDFLWHGDVGTQDGDTSKVKCPSCDELFVITAAHVVEFQYYTVEEAIDDGCLDEDEAT